jgi:hypothetical protein
VLYLAQPPHGAAPQCISGRTSYLRFRLAFHPYPQLIRAVCNPHRFGPPCPVTDTSPWPWVAQAVSGLPPAIVALFRLAFAVAPAVTALTGPPRVTRRIILQKARRQAALKCLALRLHVSNWFQGLFHSPRRGAFHRSLTVLCAIGRCVYLALGGGPPSFTPDVSCPALLKSASQPSPPCVYRALTVCGAAFQAASTEWLCAAER